MTDLGPCERSGSGDADAAPDRAAAPPRDSVPVGDPAPAAMPAALGRRMRLRYAGKCRICGAALAARADAIYEPATKTVRCVDCGVGGDDGVVASAADEAPTTAERSTPPTSSSTGPSAISASPTTAFPTAPSSMTDAGSPTAKRVAPEPSSYQPGVAGASARREYERRKAKDEQRLRQKWGRFGGIAVALADEKQSTRAWATGAAGEERIGAGLDTLASDHVAVLHDRRIPGTRANIDHIVVTRGGIWVIDAKRYRGRPMLRVDGGFLRPRVERLVVGRRDCTKLVDGVLKQVALVRGVLGAAVDRVPGAGDAAEADELVPVHGALCFIDADWPLIGGAFSTRGVAVLWPKRLVKQLRGVADGGVDVAAVRELLASRFPPA